MFEIGDVVTLKSGPDIGMTVVSIEGEYVTVEYYDDKESDSITKKFHVNMLVKDDGLTIYDMMYK